MKNIQEFPAYVLFYVASQGAYVAQVQSSYKGCISHIKKLYTNGFITSPDQCRIWEVATDRTIRPTMNDL